jgi:hypothetical protein
VRAGTDPQIGHPEVGHLHTVIPEHPFHAVQICAMICKAFAETRPRREIQEVFPNSLHPPSNMEPIEAMLTSLPKPAHHTAQSILSIR